MQSPIDMQARFNKVAIASMNGAATANDSTAVLSDIIRLAKIATDDADFLLRLRGTLSNAAPLTPATKLQAYTPPAPAPSGP